MPRTSCCITQNIKLVQTSQANSDEEIDLIQAEISKQVENLLHWKVLEQLESNDVEIDRNK